MCGSPSDSHACTHFIATTDEYAVSHLFATSYQYTISHEYTSSHQYAATECHAKTNRHSASRRIVFTDFYTKADSAGHYSYTGAFRRLRQIMCE